MIPDNHTYSCYGSGRPNRHDQDGLTPAVPEGGSAKAGERARRGMTEPCQPLRARYSGNESETRQTMINSSERGRLTKMP